MLLKIYIFKNRRKLKLTLCFDIKMPSEHTLANTANNLRIEVTALSFLCRNNEIHLRADWWLIRYVVCSDSGVILT